jgi:hypothetical protein
MLVLDIATEDGDVGIREDEIATITDADLKKLRISRGDLMRVFAEGTVLMRGVTPSDRVRPCAHETLDGRWEVVLVEYSEYNDPLMQGPPAGNA